MLNQINFTKKVSRNSQKPSGCYLFSPLIPELALVHQFANHYTAVNESVFRGETCSDRYRSMILYYPLIMPAPVWRGFVSASQISKRRGQIMIVEIFQIL